MKIRVERTDGEFDILLLPYKDGSGYSYINLTKGHICLCKFNTIEEALDDMKSKSNILRYKILDENN